MKKSSLALAAALATLACATHAQTNEATPTLAPVFVTATRTEQPLSDVLADVSVLEREDIERSGATTVAELLTTLPGVQFTRNGGPGQTESVFIRGTETRHTAVYLDGVRIDSQATGGAPWEQIPLANISRIEVVRGPAAAVYGSDAIGGVVQLFTDKASTTDKRLKPYAQVSLGTYNTYSTLAGLSGWLGDRVDFSVSGSHEHSDGIDSQPNVVVNHDRDGYERDTYNAQLGVQVAPTQRLEASVLNTRLAAQYDNSFSPLNTNDLAFEKLRTSALNWKSNWSATSKSSISLTESYSTYENEPQINFYRTETKLQNIVLSHEEDLAGNRLSATLERREDQLYNPATAFDAALSGKRHQDGLGLGWGTQYGNQALQFNARHDEDSEFGGKSTGSLAWGWAFMPHYRLSASAANAFRAPTLYQRFSEFGDPDLKPETSQNRELSLGYNQAGSELKATLWHNDVHNLIDFDSSSLACSSGFGCYENEGHAKLKGVTIAGSTHISKVALRGSLDWMDPRNVDTGLQLARRAKHQAFVAADTNAWGWTFTTEVKGVGKRFDDDANTVHLGGYSLLNFAASHSLSHGLDLLIRIDNLADKRYEIVQNYATLGRTLNVTLRWAMP